MLVYHSITFGYDKDNITSDGKLVGSNTWDDWHLIPSSRPTVAQAQPITSMVEIPGREDGPIDMSEYLTGSMQYGQRSGSFEFIVDNDHENWITLMERISSYIHGKKLYMTLEDDPNYYYEGRFTLNEWKSESWNSKVVINYVVGPYKYKLNRSANWLWDTFNLDTDDTNSVTNNEGWL